MREKGTVVTWANLKLPLLNEMRPVVTDTNETGATRGRALAMVTGVVSTLGGDEEND